MESTPSTCRPRRANGTSSWRSQGSRPPSLDPFRSWRRPRKTLDIACIEGGGIRGRVTNVPAGWAGHLWVVAFTDTSLRAEARIDADGRFSLANLTPGEYGLKVGHGCVRRCRCAAGFPQPPLWTTDPWMRARKVTVHPGREIEGVELVLPERDAPSGRTQISGICASDRP